MIDSSKKAWLVGLYTTDIEARIESLGYKITRLYPDLKEHIEVEEKPALIVFSDDQFSGIHSMRVARYSFPEALLISLPVVVEQAKYTWEYPLERKPGSSMARLITSIKEREYRWDN